MLRVLLQFTAYVRRELTEYFLLPVEASAKPHRFYRARLLGAFALVLALLAGIGYAIARLSRVNIALRKPVSSSSQALNTTPAAVVDGLRHGQLGFHSQEETASWLAIDLQSVHDVGAVLAFGRADCCFTQSIPLALELSLDGRKYEPVGLRETPFTQFEPWQVRLEPPVRARYIRLKTKKRGGFLVLSEVEVYGR